MVEKVVLVNLYGHGNISPASQNLSLQTIKQALGEKGFDQVELFPGRAIHYNEIEYWLSKAVSKTDPREVVFGISVVTDIYDKFEQIASVIRKKYRDSTLVAGGVHFQNGSEGVDIVKQPLEKRLVDGINVKNAQPFVDLIVRNNGDVTKTDTRGFYWIDDNEHIHGRGVGKYPKLSSEPYVLDIQDRLVFIDAQFADDCGNGCDYCTAFKGGKKLDVEKAKKTMEDVLKQFPDKQVILSLHDSNPLESADRDGYADVFEYIDSIHPQVFKNIYLDPASLPVDMDKFVEFLREHKIVEFNMGRECVTEEDAGIIGRRYKGEFRTQEQLDQEKERIDQFIDKLGKEFKPFLRIFYITHPFQTKKSVRQMFEELIHFKKKAKNFSFDFGMYPLRIYPGTKLRTRLYDRLKDPLDFSLQTSITVEDTNFGTNFCGFVNELNKAIFEHPEHSYYYFLSLYDFLQRNNVIKGKLL